MVLGASSCEKNGGEDPKPSTVIKVAQEIDTYETSILPYEDCCVLFSPKHPVLRASLEEANEIYNKINPDQLIQKAFDERVVKHFYAHESL